MNQDNNWLNDYAAGQLAAIKFESNWLDGVVTIKTTREHETYGNSHYVIYNQIDNYVGEYVDKDEKIRNLEARVKELESILEEEI